MSPPHNKTERGFALLEVLIAFAIAALALGVLYEAASSGGSAVRSAGLYEEAVSRAKSHLAALGADGALAEGERSGDDGGVYRWRIKVAPIAVMAPNDTSARPRGTPLLTLFAIEVGISWTIDGRSREVVLHTQRISRSAGIANG